MNDIKKDYWHSRIDNTFDKNIHKNEIAKLYLKQYRSIEGRIVELYNKAVEQGITTRSDLYQLYHFQQLLKSIKRQNQAIKSELKKETVSTLKKVYKETFSVVNDMLSGDKQWSSQNEKMLESILKTKWEGNSFSGRIWKNTDELSQRIKADVATAIVQGTNKDTLVKNIMQDFNVGYAKADRLIRTETMHAINRAQIDIYKDDGIEEVEWHAGLDERTCGICGSMHGKKYKTDRAPTLMHPNCRCTLVPVIPDSWFDDEYLKGTGKKGTQTNRSALTSNGSGGIIKEKSKKKISIITDKTIEKVSKVEIYGCTEAQNVFIQQQHKELLKFSRGKNDCKEVAFVFEKGFINRTEYIGSENSLDFGSSLLGKGNDLFVMHNHPRNSSFSDMDLVEFISFDSIKSLSVVKNNGNIEVITKTPTYDRKSIAVERERYRKKYVINGNDDEYERYISKLLNRLDRKDVIKWIK